MTTFLLAGMLVGSCLLMGFLLARSHTAFSRGFLSQKFAPGVPIIYRMQAMSDQPVHDGGEVYPSEKGESYYYVRNKYWRVEKVLQNGWIVARSPFMEEHYLRGDDPNLRKASLIERLRFASRFPYV
jgi:hypothetical protein